MALGYLPCKHCGQPPENHHSRSSAMCMTPERNTYYEPVERTIEEKQEFKFGFTGFKTMPQVECDPFLLKPQEPGTVGAAIQMLQKLDPSLPLLFDCPDCGKGHVMKTVRYSAVVETERAEERK